MIIALDVKLVWDDSGKGRVFCLKFIRLFFVQMDVKKGQKTLQWKITR